MVKFDITEIQDVTVLDASGRITLGQGSVMLRETFRALVAEGKRKFVLCVGDVSYIDSSGIGEMVSGQHLVTNSGGEIKLAALTKRVKDLLQITKLYTDFSVYDTSDDAVQAFLEA